MPCTYAVCAQLGLYSAGGHQSIITWTHPSPAGGTCPAVCTRDLQSTAMICLVNGTCPPLRLSVHYLRIKPLSLPLCKFGGKVLRVARTSEYLYNLSKVKRRSWSKDLLKVISHRLHIRRKLDFNASIYNAFSIHTMLANQSCASTLA